MAGVVVSTPLRVAAWCGCVQFLATCIVAVPENSPTSQAWVNDPIIFMTASICPFACILVLQYPVLGERVILISFLSHPPSSFFFNIYILKAIRSTT